MAGNVTYSASYLAESRAALLNTFYAIPIGLTLTTTTLRIWAKIGHHAQSRLGFDDYLMIFATIVSIAQCISGLVYGAPYGLGRHVQALSAYDLRMYMMGDYIFSHFYDVAIGCTKLAVLALYYRLFWTKKNFRIVFVATAVFVVAWIVVMEVVLGFSCWPIQAFWGDAEGKCINLVAFTYFTNITNLVTDLWIFALPIPIILKLQASKEKKIGLCFLFSIGSGTCAISAARLSFVFGVGTVDYTWHETAFGILSAWEPCGGILCANLPIIYRPLVQAIKKAKASLRRTEQSENVYQRPSDRSVSRDWTPLNDTSSLTSESIEPTTEIASKEAHSGTTEMDALDVNRILAFHGLKGET